MARHTRDNDTEREYVRREIARHYLSGKTQREIAQIVGCSQQQISYDLQMIRAEWRKERNRDWNEETNIQLAKIDALEATCWEAWYRSQEQQERNRTEERQSDRGRPIRITQVTTETTAGDPQFLQGVQWCVEQRSKLLGLYEYAKAAAMKGTQPKPYDPVADQNRLTLLINRFIETGSPYEDDETAEAG